MFVNKTLQGLRDPSWLDEVANYASTGGKIVTDAYGVYRDVTGTNQNTGVVPPHEVLPDRGQPEIITGTHPDGGGAIPQPSGGSSSNAGGSTSPESSGASSDGKILGMEPLTAGLIAGGVILAFILLSD